MTTKNTHSAEDAALGFLYQAQYALVLLWREIDDDAVVYLETLDDVVLVANGDTFLEQLKHSLKTKPPSLTVACLPLWKTLKAWIDVLHELDLSRTWFHLVAVADISDSSPLKALLDDNIDRTELLEALTEEAERVKQERSKAAIAGKLPLPHADRAAACEAFLSLSEEARGNLLARARIKPKQSNISKIEDLLADSLTTVVRGRRAQVARQLVEWWSGQVLDLLTKKRKFGLSRFELVTRYMEIVSAIELDELTSAFATAMHPSSYQCDSMIEHQISLVGGGPSELRRAVREEWRAREERSRWSRENPARHLTLPENVDGLDGPTNRDTARTIIERAFGIGDVEDPNASESFQKGRATVRDITPYLFLSGDVIISKTTLLHDMNRPEKARDIRTTMPFFLGAVDQQSVLAERKLRQLEAALGRLEREAETRERSRSRMTQRSMALLSQAAAVGLALAPGADTSDQLLLGQLQKVALLQF